MSVQEAVKKISSLSQLIKNSPELASFLRAGDLIEAKFLGKRKGAAYFDLNKFGTGIVFGFELVNAKEIVKNLKVGDVVSAKVVSLENEEGYAELSLAGASKQQGWQNLKEIMETNEILTIKVIGANSGGLISEINDIKAFLPVSHLSSEHYPRMESNEKEKILAELRKFVGQDLKVKILDLNSRVGKLIISERGAIEEDIKKLLEKYKVGDIVEGIISGVTNFGAFVRFVDEPAIEGLIHLSELEHRIIESPKEVVKVDEAVKVKIIEIKDSQVFLSLKAIKLDPWDKIEEKFKEKQEVKGIVCKFYPFGALINLEHGLQGLINVAEFGGVEEMKSNLEPGKEYQFIIDLIKPQEKRIILKIKK
ncbi:MAG: S1 RNA-binding domain-containing protein [Patescibacteria group bacterium]